MEKLNQLKSGKIEPNVFPLMWIHGESEEEYANEIEHIYQSGIRAICIEARPHNDFNGPGWFKDLGILLSECRKRGMEVWLLDDSHFPTGYANGEVKKNHPQLQKQYLCLKSRDFQGPIPCSGASLNYLIQSPEDEILGVYLQKRIGFEQIDCNETIDVTGSLQWISDYHTGKPNTDMLGNPAPGVGGKIPVVAFDLPEGQWTLQVVSVSYKGGEKQTEGYLNPMVPEATDILLNTVYQPVYEHFSEDFGKTFRGFFSDEPRFGNIHGAENASIGRNSAMVLPWYSGMEKALFKECQKAGGVLADLDMTQFSYSLPLLFMGDGEVAHALRYTYMNLVSRLYSENFDGRIAQWCHAHHCERIGHTIEDNDAATRLGYGAGHIFRAMEHADMAGIDVVIHQLTPGFDKGMFKGMHSPGWDGKFFTYLLGKFGGSLAHLDEKKKGRAMCELFGAYGWAEGNRLMKWLADYMLVNGINHLVPHAFDAGKFPNGDCPPHMYGDGHNPQYPEFRLLMDYCSRMCTLFNDGYNITPAALYLNAEGEWSGDYQNSSEAAYELGRALIDYDLISMDYLLKAEMTDGKLHINKENFSVLILPYAEALPYALLQKVNSLAAEGLPVYFVDALPQKSSEGIAIEAFHENVNAVALSDLVMTLHQKGLYELRSTSEAPTLHYYHYRQKDADLYFFTNQSPAEDIDVYVEGLNSGIYYSYDAFLNEVWKETEPDHIQLPAYGSKLLICPKQPITDAKEKEAFCQEEKITLGACRVVLTPMENLNDPDYLPEIVEMTETDFLNRDRKYQTFCGRMCYCYDVELTEVQAQKDIFLTLDGVQEAAAVSWNDQPAGTKICPDFCFELKDPHVGHNKLCVELNTTLGRIMNDFLSQFLPMAAVGMRKATLHFGKKTIA